MKAEEIDWVGDVFGEGSLTTADVNDYFDVIKEAYLVHLDRERIRNGLWKEYPAEDQCNQIKVKIDRTLRSLERLKVTPPTTPFEGQMLELKENAIQELYDIINYANFAVRLLEGTAP